MARRVGLLLGWLLASMPAADVASSQKSPTAGDDGGRNLLDTFAAGPGAAAETAQVAEIPFRAAAQADAGPGYQEDGDGFSNAPLCTIQYPSLLSKYRARPPWRVAGVDYCVGYPTGGALKDPLISMTGVSVNVATKTITVTGNNVTLDGYDFSRNGGWGVVVRGDNARILNSKFLVGLTSNQPILATQSVTNLYVGYCIVDGNNNPDVGGLIEMRGSGTLTVEYSWLKNAGSDIIQLHGFGGNVVVTHNLLENAGMAPGAHGDYTEFIGGPYSASIVYNTTMQSGGTTQGFMVEPDVGSSVGTIVSGEIGYNTFTAKGGGINAYTGVTVADIVNTFRVHENYFDPKGTLSGLAFGGNIRGGPNDRSPRSVYVNNVNMLTGAVLEDASATAKRLRR